MAVYTVELRDVIADVFNESEDNDDWEQEYHTVIYNSIEYGKLPIVPDWSKIGLGTYPIFDENYRDVLNGKIVDNYFTREIGVETIDMFLLTIRRKMDLIMPYFNKLYESEKIPYEALETMRIHSVSANTTDETGSVDTETTNETTTESGGRVVSSTTPQTMLAANADYATNATDSKSNSDVLGETNQSSASVNSTESNGDNLVTGFQGISSELVTRFRASLLNIDEAIIIAIEDCFMLILNSGDSYTPAGYGW